MSPEVGNRPLILLLDDTRDFKDGRANYVARTSADAIALLDSLSGQLLDELWLDYDLTGDDTAQPVVQHLVNLAAIGNRQPVGVVWVHSSNIRHGHRITAELVAAGYPARRSYAANLFIRAGSAGHSEATR
ncbi:hypothetical protein BJ986_002248 [Phycicoccus badiiscoriae]|uniref:Cyclic-phosphate processing Receiver domain-containing protein n=1 Tax=Pedococcus badiiscoriae TaxID=642776 RepID=A0A852WJF7_9MICO|nr:cyclic-phosphate processing receiver domain-containing protein [Pedococcus badiiscoriae]NYG07761.1 hypothetical protein [Pedococcus badiiscoriae]